MNDGYVRAYRSFLQLTELKHSDKMVFLGLWSFGNTSGICWPSQKELGRASAVSPRQVRTSLNNLTRMGLVITERRGTGRLSPLRYRLAPLDRAALIVAGQKNLEEKKARWLETLGAKRKQEKPSAGDANALIQDIRSDRQKLPPPPENRGLAEGVRKILPLSSPCRKAISETFDRREPEKAHDEAKEGPMREREGHFLPVGAATSAGTAAIPAYRTRTRELKPEKKNQEPRPWERYLKPQPSGGKTAAEAFSWGESVPTG